METKRHFILSITTGVLLAILFSTAVTTVQAISIADGWALWSNASRLLLAPDIPRIVNTTYSGNTTTINIFPTYRFDGNSTGWTDGQIYTPRRITFPFPFCDIVPFNIVSESPASCIGGRLLYGLVKIPATLSVVPNRSEEINGHSDVLIQGQAIPALDAGGSQPNIGTLTYELAPGCPMNESTFHVVLAGSGMHDEADYVPLAYTDSASNITLWANILGLGCSLTLRSPSSPAFDPEATMIPICKNLVPSDFPGLDPTLYSAMFGSGFAGTNSVPANGIVYQIRVDNLDTTNSGIDALVRVRFVYLDLTEETISPLYVNFNEVIYVWSNGTSPAFVYVCFYQEDCVPAQIYNEAQLTYLQACNCQSVTGNLPCNGSNDITTPVNRTSLPNYNENIIFEDPPACGFFVNVANNGSNPIAGISFVAQSTAFGGTGPINYNWQLSNTPPSAGIIIPPTTASSVTILITVPGAYNLTHVVSNPNGVGQTCSQWVTVTAGPPTACMSPAGPTLTIAPGQVQTLDATCSDNPLPGALTYLWVLAYSFGSTATLSSSSDPIITFTSPGTGVYQVILVVTNNASSSSTFINIFVDTAAPVAPPAGTPTTPAPPPFSCFVDTNQTVIPMIGPTALPPVSVIPLGPPVPVGTVPGTTPSSVPGEASPAAIQTLTTVLGVTIAAILVVIVFVIVAACVRARFRSPSPSSRKFQ